MGLDRLTLGLWLRMLVASAVAVVGIGGLLLAEFAIAALMLSVAILLVPQLALVVLGLVVLATVAFGLWIAVGTVLRLLLPGSLIGDRIAHDATADALESLVRGVTDPRVPVTRRDLAIAVGAPLLALAGYQLIDLLPAVTPLRLGAVVGAGLVCYGTVRLIRDEWTADGAVRQDVAAAARVPDAETVDGADETIRTDLQRRVDRLAAQTDVPAPTVSLGRSRAPVAASVGYRPAASTVVVSRGLVETLDDRELEAVLAHELAHVANRDAAVLTALSLPASKVESVLFDEVDDPGVTGPHQGFLLLPALPVLLVTSLAVASLARYREYVADRGAVALTGDPAALASALETLDRDVARRPVTDLRSHRSTAAFSIVPPPWEEHRFFDRTRRFVSRRLFGTHPPTEKRIERLRPQP